MPPLRLMAAAGALALTLVLPAAAQTTGPTDGGAQRDGQTARPATPPPPPPPLARDTQPPATPRAEPPARADDEFEPPSDSGCRYRDNQLELIV